VCGYGAHAGQICRTGKLAAGCTLPHL
jgi:hypothetical protein